MISTANVKAYANNLNVLGDKTGNLGAILDELQGESAPYVATAANYTALASDVIVGVTSTSAARTITLPASSAGKRYIVKDESGAAGTNHITVTPTAGTLDGAASGSIATNYGVLRLYFNGTNWFSY